MKHDKVCISGRDLLANINTDNKPWWRVLDLPVPTMVAAVYDADRSGEEVPDELRAEADAAERAAYDKYAAAWFVVGWPEHVINPRFNGDAYYSCPMTREEARDRADCEYIA